MSSRALTSPNLANTYIHFQHCFYSSSVTTRTLSTSSSPCIGYSLCLLPLPCLAHLHFFSLRPHTVHTLYIQHPCASNKKLLGTRASLLGARTLRLELLALLLVTRTLLVAQGHHVLQLVGVTLALASRWNWVTVLDRVRLEHNSSHSIRLGLLGARTLLGAKGIATRSKDATRGSWPYY